MAGHEVRFQSRRLIIVELAALLIAQVVVTLVVIVMGKDGHILLKFPDQIVHQRGLAAAGTAGNADD